MEKEFTFNWANLKFLKKFSLKNFGEISGENRKERRTEKSNLRYVVFVHSIEGPVVFLGSKEALVGYPN